MSSSEPTALQLPAVPDDGWAQAELGTAQLGDTRRTQRLVDLAATLGAHPTESLPDACGTPARAKAAYRLFDLAERTPGCVPEFDLPAAILAPHIAATVDRIADRPLVLAVQDTTSLDYTAHPATTGLGYLEAPQRRGLFLHSTLAVEPVAGTPLGLLASQVWARTDAELGRRRRRKSRATQEKESQKWLTGALASRAVVPAGVTVVQVGDREADIYDLFRQVQAQPDTDMLIRAQWDRRVSEPEAHLVATVEAQPVADERTITVPRAVERSERTARVRLRWAPVTLRPPRDRPVGLPTIRLTAILVEEVDPPATVNEPIHWLLLTSLAVTDCESAWRCVRWYSYRWRIERYHFVLKSGCRVERLQLETAKRLEACLALYSVLALRLLQLLHASRAEPDAPGTMVLSEEGWAVLWAARHPKRPMDELPPIPCVREVMRELAMLGGFMGRRGDGDPGVVTLWRGIRHLHELLTGYHLAHRLQHFLGNA